MHCLHLISSLDAKAGGTAEAVRQLSLAAIAAGDEVEIATLDTAPAEWAGALGIACHGLGPASLKFSYSRRLMSWLRRHRDKFDAIIVYGLWQYPSFAAWRTLRDGRVFYFAFPHGMLDPWFRRTYPLKHAKKWLYWPLADYRALRGAAGVLFTCNQERRLARQSFWPYRVRERVVPLGTGAPPDAAERQHDAFLGRHPGLEATRVLLFLGCLHPKKGCDLLLDAFAAVRGADPRLRLVFAWPDVVGWAAELRRRADALGIAQLVTWTGMLEGDAKWLARTCYSFSGEAAHRALTVAVRETTGR